MNPLLRQIDSVLDLKGLRQDLTSLDLLIRYRPMAMTREKTPCFQRKNHEYPDSSSVTTYSLFHMGR